MDEFEKFTAKEGESLESVYERLATLMNIIDRNNVRPISVSINTKFLNCLQPEWRKYVTMARHNQTVDTVLYDQLYDSLVQFEPHVQASKAKKAAKNLDPLAYLVIQMLPRHNLMQVLLIHIHHNHTMSHILHQFLIMKKIIKGRYGGNGNRNAGRQNRNQSLNAGNGLTQNDENNHIVPRTESNLGKANLQCYNCNEKSHYVCDCQKPRVRDAKLTAAVIMMARIQLADDDAVTEPNYDAKAVSEVNASHNMIPKGVHEHKNYGKRKTVITTFDDDQIDSNIIFDDPYIENNDGSAEHDSNAHD
nr:hypothetical protein [Tanacetum cinerariifolium]